MTHMSESAWTLGMMSQCLDFGHTVPNVRHRAPGPPAASP